MDKSCDYDVIVVGAGIVGHLFAKAVTSIGLRVALIDAGERNHATSQSLKNERAIALSLGSKKILAGLEQWAFVEKKTEAINKIHISERKYFGRVRLDASRFNLPAFGYVVGWSTLTELIQKATRQCVHVIRPGYVQDIKTHKYFSSVACQVLGKTDYITSKLVVITDGAGSSTREFLGIEPKVFDYRQVALASSVETERPHENIAYERFTHTGPLAMLPLQQRRCGLIWTLGAEHVDYFRGLTDKSLLLELQVMFGDRLGKFRSIGSRNFFPVKLTRTRKVSVGRTIAIGNAAHGLHPIAGQGLNLAIRDVALLAEFIADSHYEGGDIGHTELLRRYERHRAADHRIVCSATHGLVRLFSNDSFPLAIGRNVGLTFFECLPIAKRAMVRQATGLAGYQSRLARGQSL